MSTFTSSFSASKDTEVSRLKAENHSLAEELTQCQADKEFVWSLWKRLQVANPDITQAVGLVAQREKEKAELKDRKVLEILNVKDDKIDELQKLVATQSKELAQLILTKNELDERACGLERENADARMRVEQLDSDVRERAGREAVRELDRENLELKQELSRNAAEIERLHKENDDLVAVRDSHRDRIKTLEDDYQEISDSYETITKQHDDSKRQVRKLEQQVTSLQKQLKTKSKELEQVRAEMAEIWSTHRQTADHATQQADVIRQLQQLQTDTQKMLQNTETAYSMEKMTLQTENQSIRGTEMELRRQLEMQAQTIAEQDKLLQQLQEHLESKEVTLKDMESGAKVNSRLSHLQEEIEDLKYKLTNRSRSVSPSPPPTRSRSKGKKGGGRGKLRSRSLSVHGEHAESDIRIVTRRLENTERKLSDTQLLLHMKNKEVEELRAAHNRRLDRLKAVQTDHRLVKQQCAVLEEELHGPKRPSKKKVRKSPTKALQKENSDAVWNELAFFRKQAKNHQVENVNLQEEVDALRVKLTQCEATIHELNACLEQEREELQFVLEQQREHTSSPAPPDQQHEVSELRRQLDHYRGQLDKFRDKLSQASVDGRAVEEEKERTQEERRALKAEINILRQQDSQYRIKIADFKNEIARLHRDAKRNKKKSQTKEKARQYQQTLNQSIQAMSQVFDDFNKDGWEDVSASEERTDDVTLTSATMTSQGTSLGEDIVAHAQNSLHDDRSFAGPRLSSTPSRGRPVSRLDSEDEYRRLSRADDVRTRSIALSPIRFPTASPERRSRPHTRPDTRSIALSPHRPSPPTPPFAKVVSKKVGHSAATTSRQVAALKQRVAALINQVAVIKSAKDASMRSNLALKATVEQLEGELTAGNTRTQSLRQTVTRLTTEVDRLKADRELLEQRLHDHSLESSTQPLHSDQEFASVQARLKASTGEVSRQLAQIKALKADNAGLEDRVATLQERVKSLERDNAQKRILAEDMKLKLKLVQENVKSDADIMEDVEHKMRTLAEINARYKTQLDSLRTRLAAVTKEKSDNEDKVVKLSNELDRKGKLVGELQMKARGLQSTVVTVERTAQQQLSTLADHSEAAIDTAQVKLTQMDGQLQEYAKFITVLAHTLVSSTQQARQFVTHQKLKRELTRREEQDLDASLHKFKSVACDILNIDETQLDDIMHAEKVDATKLQELQVQEDQKKDRKWNKKWERVLQSKGDFSVPLVDVFMEKVDERCRLATEIAVT